MAWRWHDSNASDDFVLLRDHYGMWWIAYGIQTQTLLSQKSLEKNKLWPNMVSSEESCKDLR